MEEQNNKMLSDIKEELLKSPDSIQSILEHFGYANIRIHDRYISCGRDQFSSAKSIVIRLDNNKYLYVTDYPKNIHEDLFSYIIDQRGVTFRDVISVTNQCLGIDNYPTRFEKRVAFSGFYNRIKKETSSSPPKIYNPEILDEYERIGNIRFLKDHISLESQRFFDLRYDRESDGIVIPIYDPFDNLMGAKERINREPEPDEQKYWYLYPCQMSKTLYGFAKNYKYLAENTVLIFESEKSVMQCYSYGLRNAVALGSGSISRQQIRMLYEIQPKEVIFLHDVGFDFSSIERNITSYQRYSRFSETKVGYWDWRKSGLKEKFSPSDLGKDYLKEILEKEIVFTQVGH